MLENKLIRSKRVQVTHIKHNLEMIYWLMYGAVDICVVFLQLDSLSEVRVLNISGKFHYFFFFSFFSFL